MIFLSSIIDNDRNYSSFSRRSEYDRRKNLDLICSAIKRVSDLNVAVNKRDDIVIDDLHKVNNSS